MISGTATRGNLYVAAVVEDSTDDRVIQIADIELESVEQAEEVVATLNALTLKSTSILPPQIIQIGNRGLVRKRYDLTDGQYKEYIFENSQQRDDYLTPFYVDESE